MTGETLTVHLVALSELARVPAQLPVSLPAAELATIASRVHMRHRRRTEAAVLLAHTLVPAARVNAGAGPPVEGAAVLSVSHDHEFVTVAAGGPMCGVDIEDHPRSRVAEFAPRFCTTAELTGPTCPRGLWAAKESAAKAIGRGLSAGFRSMSFADDPVSRWSAVRWEHGAGFLTRCVDLGRRHFAITVLARRPPAVSVHLWSPVHDGRRWWLTPATRRHATSAALAAALSDVDGGFGG